MSREIYYRGDGNLNIGMGHIMRLSAMAYRLKEESTPKFCLVNSDKRVKKYLSRLNYDYLEYINDYEFLNSVNKNSIVIVDGYNFSTNFFQNLKNKGSKVIYIDDLITNNLPVDIIINHSPGIKKSDYILKPKTKLFLGLDYCLIRNSFLDKNKPRIIKNIDEIVVSLGMSNSGKLLSKIVADISKIKTIKKINVLVGGNKISYLEENKESIMFHSVTSEKKIIDIFDRSQLAIVPMSTLYMEAASRNTIVLGGYFVPNQIEVYNRAIKCGVVYGIGDLKNIDSIKLGNAIKKIEDLLPKRVSNNFGNGFYKIIEVITSWIK